MKLITFIPKFHSSNSFLITRILFLFILIIFQHTITVIYDFHLFQLIISKLLHFSNYFNITKLPFIKSIVIFKNYAIHLSINFAIFNLINHYFTLLKFSLIILIFLFFLKIFQFIIIIIYYFSLLHLIIYPFLRFFHHFHFTSFSFIKFIFIIQNYFNRQFINFRFALLNLFVILLNL
jgi:hypothetical protein